jgi:hypothetical protein
VYCLPAIRTAAPRGQARQQVPSAGGGPSSGIPRFRACERTRSLRYGRGEC